MNISRMEIDSRLLGWLMDWTINKVAIVLMKLNFTGRHKMNMKEEARPNNREKIQMGLHQVVQVIAELKARLAWIEKLLEKPRIHLGNSTVIQSFQSVR